MWSKYDDNGNYNPPFVAPKTDMEDIEEIEEEEEEEEKLKKRQS